MATPPLYPPPQIRHGTEGERNILQSPALVIQPTRLWRTDLTNSHAVCTRRVFGGTDIELRPSSLESTKSLLTSLVLLAHNTPKHTRAVSVQGAIVPCQQLDTWPITPPVSSIPFIQH
ncbi:hypothetical protein TNCV_1264181 [Trichonephila clavipes]|nr:hypothetical protein TNCV_1264181 [Trichonephila clavipes]